MAVPPWSLMAVVTSPSKISFFPLMAKFLPTPLPSLITLSQINPFSNRETDCKFSFKRRCLYRVHRVMAGLVYTTSIGTITTKVE